MLFSEPRELKKSKTVSLLGLRVCLRHNRQADILWAPLQGLGRPHRSEHPRLGQSQQRRGYLRGLRAVERGHPVDWRQAQGGACQAALPIKETREVGKPKSPERAGDKGRTVLLICLCTIVLVDVVMWKRHLVPQQPLGSMRRQDSKPRHLGAATPQMPHCEI